MTHGENKKNFQIYTAEEFIAAITQHIPEKSFQMVRYYGWYSNKSRGVRIKHGIVRPGDQPVEDADNIYRCCRLPAKTGSIKNLERLYKKIYEVDPLCCPKCSGEMRIISFITDEIVTKEILDHLGLWTQKPSRDPPKENSGNKINELVYEPIVNDWPGYEEPYIGLD